MKSPRKKKRAPGLGRHVPTTAWFTAPLAPSQRYVLHACNSPAQTDSRNFQPVCWISRRPASIYTEHITGCPPISPCTCRAALQAWPIDEYSHLLNCDMVFARLAPLVSALSLLVLRAYRLSRAVCALYRLLLVQKVAWCRVVLVVV